MYASWLTRRYEIKDAIRKLISSPLTAELEIIRGLQSYNLNTAEFETYKLYIEDLKYEVGMKENFKEEKVQETITGKFDLNSKVHPNIAITQNIKELCVDGHCVPGEGAKGYARVTDQLGNPLLQLFNLSDYKVVKVSTPKGDLDAIEVYSDDTPKQQINYAEITALHVGLRIALCLGIRVVNLDSVTSNAWSDGRIPSSIKDPQKLKICEEATKFRREFKKLGGTVCKIDGKKNPADFGFHK